MTDHHHEAQVAVGMSGKLLAATTGLRDHDRWLAERPMIATR